MIAIGVFPEVFLSRLFAVFGAVLLLLTPTPSARAEQGGYRVGVGIADITGEAPRRRPADAAVGTYRIVHHGDAKSLTGAITPFTGTSRTFVVTP